MKNPTVFEMIKEYLKANGFGGLYGKEDEEDGCGCELDELFVCDGEDGCFDCKAGYKIPDGDFWIIVPEKPEKEKTDDKAEG